VQDKICSGRRRRDRWKWRWRSKNKKRRLMKRWVCAKKEDLMERERERERFGFHKKKSWFLHGIWK
jgi:hypothetical protein